MTSGLNEHQLLLTLLALAVIWVVGRTGGELARRARQPEVLGELLAGFVLGPSVLGAALPSLQSSLFTTHAVSLVLSGFSWVGALLLLLAAGLEVDLAILRSQTRPGVLAAAFAIIPSLVVGTAFAWFALGRHSSTAAYLGVVLSVTGVSVAAKILMERGTLRREYAQVILAAGVGSEVLVWLMISVMSSLHGGSPALAFLRSLLFATGFLLLMMTAGRRLIFWAMRRVSDLAWIIKGQLTLVLVLTFMAAAATQALGLHALLGAFVVGVILAQSPRVSRPLLENMQTLTVGMFATIFFVLAGTRVDIFRLGHPSALLLVVALFVVATGVKVGFAGLGARLGGLRPWESSLVGVGLNLKGGTDIIVAIIGTELGLFSVSAYTMYAVVAMATVLVSPPVISWMERRAPPGEVESNRLIREQAAALAYVPNVERVIVPITPSLLPTLAASLMQSVASAKSEAGQTFDIAELAIERSNGSRAQDKAEETVAESLEKVGGGERVEVTKRRADVTGALKVIQEAAGDFDLIALGARPPRRRSGVFTLGRLQDRIIDDAGVDVVVAIDHEAETFDQSAVRHILVATNGMEYSMDAGDLAGAIAFAAKAEVTLLYVVQPAVGEMHWRQRERNLVLHTTARSVDELAFRLGRYGVPIHKEVRVGESVPEAILHELDRGAYDLLVMGGVDRGRDGRIYLGHTIESVLTRGRVPSVLLISHD